MRKIEGVGPLDAEIMVVGEAPGKDEEKYGQPFVGASGKLLNSMLEESGIRRDEVRIENVCKYRPPRNKIDSYFGGPDSERFLGRDAGPFIREGWSELRDRIAQVRPSTIIALGNTALWATTGKQGIQKWAGSMEPTCPDLSYHCRVIPTYHPAYILRSWDARFLAVHDIKRAKRETGYGREIRVRPTQYQVEPSFQDVHGRIHYLLERADCGPLYLAVDLETYRRHIGCIGLAWSREEAICIPFFNFEKEDKCYWSESEEAQVVILLRRLLTHKNVWVIGHNFDFDIQYIARWWGFMPNLKWDTMTCGHSIFSRMRKGLDANARLFIDNYRYWKEDGKSHDPRAYKQMDYWIYNCDDCTITYEVMEEQQAALAGFNFPKVEGMNAAERQMSFHPQFTWAMLRGVKTDVEEAKRLAMVCWDQISRRQARLNRLVGRPINPRSPKQLKELFYEDLGQKKIYNFKAGRRTLSCDKNALPKIASREPILIPIVEAIDEIRSLGTLRSVATQPLDHDRRMRCQYSVPGTYTYRQNSRSDAFGFGTNLQNLTTGNEARLKAQGADLSDPGVLYKPNMRRLLIPDPGYTIEEVDLKAADAQVVAAECEDEEWLRQLRDPSFDLHTFHAMEIWGYKKEDVDPIVRHKFGKTFVHLTNYAGTEYILATTLGISQARAREAQDRYFEIRPGVKRWHTRVFNQLSEGRYVQNKWGYRCYFFDRIDGSLLKEALAWIPQSTVAITTNEGIRRTINDPEFTELRMEFLLQTHDSATFQYPTRFKKRAREVIYRNMVVPIPYPHSPLLIGVDGECSEKSWGDCK